MKIKKRNVHITNNDLKTVLAMYGVKRNELENYTSETFVQSNITGMKLSANLWNSSAPEYYEVGVKIYLSGKDGEINVRDYWVKLNTGEWTFAFRELPCMPAIDEDGVTVVRSSSGIQHIYDDWAKNREELRITKFKLASDDETISRLVKEKEKRTAKAPTKKHNERGAGRHRKDYTEQYTELCRLKEEKLSRAEICAKMSISLSTYKRICAAGKAIN